MDELSLTSRIFCFREWYRAFFGLGVGFIARALIKLLLEETSAFKCRICFESFSSMSWTAFLWVYIILVNSSFSSSSSFLIASDDCVELMSMWSIMESRASMALSKVLWETNDKDFWTRSLTSFCLRGVRDLRCIWSEKVLVAHFNNLVNLLRVVRGWLRSGGPRSRV